MVHACQAHTASVLSFLCNVDWLRCSPSPSPWLPVSPHQLRHKQRRAVSHSDRRPDEHHAGRHRGRQLQCSSHPPRRTRCSSPSTSTALRAGAASFAPATNAVGALTGCVLRLNNTRVRCDWLSGTGGAQTLTVTINVAAGAAPRVGERTGARWVRQGATRRARRLHLRHPAGRGRQRRPPRRRADADNRSDHPDERHSAPTSAVVAPTSAVVAPTSAAATTDPGDLPATGGSDASALIALVVLALGAFLLIIARKFRET